jgi:hypothetical protein
MKEMKENSSGSTENQLLGMAEQERRTLRDAVTDFGTWITQCNERIDEKKTKLQ